MGTTLDLRITLFSPELSRLSPRLSTFPTWQISPTLANYGKSIVHPRSPCLMWFCNENCCFWALSEKLCPWQEKLVSTQQTGTHKVFPSQTGYNKRSRTTKFLRTSQDQSHAKPPTSGVLKSLITLGVLPQPHQNITNHNTRVQTCTIYWRTSKGSYRVLAWNASSPWHATES